MYYVIDKNGDYQELRSKSVTDAMADAFSRYTAEEAAELEIEVIDDATEETICTWEEWADKTLSDFDRKPLTIKDILTASGMTMAEISRRFEIPYRTIQDWVAGRRTPPEYVLRLLAAALEKE